MVFDGRSTNGETKRGSGGSGVVFLLFDRIDDEHRGRSIVCLYSSLDLEKTLTEINHVVSLCYQKEGFYPRSLPNLQNSVVLKTRQPITNWNSIPEA